MANFTQALNTDLNSKLTTAVYDANIAQWMQKTQNHVQNSSGIWVPLQLNANGNLKAAVSEALPVGNNNIGDVDIASATTLESRLGALTDAAIVDPTVSAAVISLLKGLLKQHQGNGSVKDQADVVDRAARVLGKITADDSALAQLGALAAVAVTDPTAAASVIALLKGLLKQLQGSGTGAQNISLISSIETINTTPVVGVKTVTATAAEVFAGASAKSNRRKLSIKNEDPILRFRIGPSSVTQQTGYPVEPGATVVFQFDPAAAVPIYAISEGVNITVAVLEI